MDVDPILEQGIDTETTGKRFLSYKTFTFIESETESAVEVFIPEVAEAAYGLYTWPCAPVLAQYVWCNRCLLDGKRVLEIGSGTALTGIVAAKCGANVILSDSALYTECLENCRRSCDANGLSGIRIVPITWGLVTPTLMQLGPVDYILGSDCFYDTKDFEDVLVTISYLMQSNCKCEFWCTYQARSVIRSIEFFLKKWSLVAREVSVSSFFTEDCVQAFDCPGIDNSLNSSYFAKSVIYSGK